MVHQILQNITSAKTTTRVPQVLGLSMTSRKALLCMQWQEVKNEIVNANLIMIVASGLYIISDDDSVSDPLSLN